MSKITLLLAGGIGYVLGARAGRERYEQIKSAATTVRNNPQVQKASQDAVDLAKDKAPLVKDRMADAAGAARSKVGGDSY